MKYLWRSVASSPCFLLFVAQWVVYQCLRKKILKTGRFWVFTNSKAWRYLRIIDTVSNFCILGGRVAPRSRMYTSCVISLLVHYDLCSYLFSLGNSWGCNSFHILRVSPSHDFQVLVQLLCACMHLCLRHSHCLLAQKFPGFPLGCGSDRTVMMQACKHVRERQCLQGLF